MKEKKVKRFLAIFLMSLGIIALTNYSSVAAISANYNEIHNENIPIDINNEIMNNQVNDVNIIKETIREILIDDVNTHIRRHFNIYDSNIPEYLVDCSLKYDIDLCFMMAQTRIETGFGTAGAGKPSSRHSLFGVCKRYGNYSDAITDYCKLLRKSYLGDKRTEHDLMRNYITLGGARYAGARGYERELRNEYDRIRNNTQIYDLWIALKNMQ